MTETPPPPHEPREVGHGWRNVSYITWIAVAACMIAITITSRTVGRSVWWLGPSTQPRPFFFLLIPLVIVAIPFFYTSKSLWLMAKASTASSLLLLATCIPDISSSPGVAAAVGVVGIAALAESIALVMVTRHYR